MTFKRKPEELRLFGVCGAMAYGGLLNHEWPNEPITLDHVIEYLEKLRDVLREIAQNHDRERERLRHLEAVLEGGALLFGELLKRKEGVAA